MDQRGGMRKVKVASHRLNQCQQVSRSVCETAGWFEESWCKRVSGDLSLFSTAPLVHSLSFLRFVVMWGEARTALQVWFTSQTKDNSIVLSPSLPFSPKHLCHSVSLFSQLIWASLLWLLCLIASWIANLIQLSDSMYLSQINPASINVYGAWKIFSCVLSLQL